jgi:hypothetical protein
VGESAVYMALIRHPNKGDPSIPSTSPAAKCAPLEIDRCAMLSIGIRYANILLHTDTSLFVNYVIYKLDIIATGEKGRSGTQFQVERNKHES